jgi:hypothetical protein
MNPELIAISIPIVAILAGISVAIVGMLANHRLRLQRTELRHRERLAAIEKGFELPPDPPDVDPKRMDQGRFLRHGLVLLAVGATLTAAMMQIPGPVPYLFGLVPAAIGVAYLIYYYVHGRHAAGPHAGVPPSGPGANAS